MRPIRILSGFLFLTLIGTQLSVLVLLENHTLPWMLAFITSSSASWVLFYNLYFLHHKQTLPNQATEYQIVYIQKPSFEEDLLYRQIKNRSHN